MITLASLFLLHFFHFFYLGHPWYAGAVWSNIFVLAVAAPLGWLWSKTKFWPLRPIKHGLELAHDKLDGLHARHDAHDEHLLHLIGRVQELHVKHDALRARMDAVEQDHHDTGSTADEQVDAHVGEQLTLF